MIVHDSVQPAINPKRKERRGHAELQKLKAIEKREEATLLRVRKEFEALKDA